MSPVVESYQNQLLGGPLARCDRWVLSDYPSLLMGGTIHGVEDWKHLQKDFGVTHVLSVESEHTDKGTVPEGLLLETPVADDGNMKPPEVVRSWISFARAVVTTGGGKLYVHCQQGGSRTPMVVYALLRAVYFKTQEEALAILRGHNGWGDAPGHQNYIRSVEDAIR